MANFKTHVQFATIGSGLISTAFLGAQLLEPGEAFLCWIAGTFGGILPDIDSDNSHSLDILFNLFSLGACFFVALALMPKWPLLTVWLACAATFIVVRFGLRAPFEWLTVHRGIFHSLLAGSFFAVLVAAAAGWLGADATLSWFLGMFTGMGYVLHLLLDEIYSVDFNNVSIKRSFGTALKPLDRRNLRNSAAMAAVTGGLFLVAPSYAEFAKVVFNSTTYQYLMAAILPA